MWDWLLRLDDRMFIRINQEWAMSFLDPIMAFLSSSVTFVPFYIWAIYRLIRRYGKKSYKPILLAIIAFGLADSISSRVFKPAFKRDRPAFEQHLTPRLPDGMPGGRYGFVSSHSANAFALYPLLMGMVFYQKELRFSQNKHLKIAVFGALFVSFWIAYSRVYLGRHYVGDVAVGGLLGGIIGYAVWRFYLATALKKSAA
jgi:undecaprenyl-diphosphatase